MLDLPLHQVVLGAGMQSGGGECFVVEAGQHDQGHLRRHPLCALHRFEALRIRETEIDHYEVMPWARRC